jgi:hypothetical protein
VLTLSAVSSAAPITQGTTVLAADPYNVSAQQTLINQDRATNGGLAPLAWDTCLAGIAQQNADRMAAQGYISHTNGVTLDLACIAGANHSGENVAYMSGGINDAQANTMFMNSPGHRANILGSFNYVATAWTVAPNGYAYIAEEFLNAPQPPPPPVPDPFKGMYTLEAYGPVHADSASAPLAGAPYWPNWRIARAIALLSDASGGYVLDGFGGIHPFGAAGPVNGAAYWPNWNIARDLVLLPSATASAPAGYTLDGYGALHAFGGAPAVSNFAYFQNFDIARKAVLLSDGSGGYVMDGWGGLHPFSVGLNPLPPAISNNAYWPGWRIARDLVLTPGSTAANVSGMTLDGYGGLHPFGSESAVSSAAYWPNWDIARSVRLSPLSTAAAPQGWVLDGYGGLHPFGGAPTLYSAAYWPGRDIAIELALQ